jgi:hypothetical protein
LETYGILIVFLCSYQEIIGLFKFDDYEQCIWQHMLERILDVWVVELNNLSIYFKYGEWFDLFEDSTQDPKGVFCMTKNFVLHMEGVFI